MDPCHALALLRRLTLKDCRESFKSHLAYTPHANTEIRRSTVGSPSGAPAVQGLDETHARLVRLGYLHELQELLHLGGGYQLLSRADHVSVKQSSCLNPGGYAICFGNIRLENDINSGRGEKKGQKLAREWQHHESEREKASSEGQGRKRKDV